MFSHSSLLPNPWLDLVADVIFVALFWIVGRLLCGNRLHGTEVLERTASMLVVGMLFTVGVATTLIYGRVGAHTLVPLVLLGTALVGWRRLPKPELTGSADERWQVPLALAVVVVGVALFQAWYRDWATDAGMVRMDHSDLGYWAMLAKALPVAKVSNAWVATMGEAAVSSGGVQDEWYHWGPMWLSMMITKLTGLPALESLLCVGSSLMLIMLALVAAAIVRSLTGWGIAASVAMGALSMMALPYPSIFQASNQNLLPFGWLQHSRTHLGWSFSYQFEAVQVFLILLCWLRGRTVLSLVFLFCATLSSPHFVAGGGVAVGTLMLISLMRRDKRLATWAALAVGTILLAWTVTHFAFGSGTDSLNSSTSGMLSSAIGTLPSRVWPVTADLLIAALLSILFIPGWVALIRSPGEGVAERVRFLGWLAVSGLVGGIIAFHVFSHVQALHFTGFPTATFAMPIAAWGLAVLVSRTIGWHRGVAIALIAIAVINGGMDSAYRKNVPPVLPWTVDDFTTLKQHLGGETFGYVARSDRSWWLPKFAFIASLLDSRCIRLNPLQSADVDDKYSKAFGVCLPMDVVPYEKGEPVNGWSLKLARKIGVRYLLHSSLEPLPPAIISECTPVVQVKDIILYRLKQAGPTVN